MPRTGKGARPPAANDGAEEELIVFFTKLKGSSDTIKRSLDTVNSALAAIAGGRPTVVRRPVAAGHQKQIGNGGDSNGQAADEVLDEHVIDVEAEEEETGQPAPSDGAPVVPRKRPMPKFLPDFALDQSNDHWQDFAARKNPKSDTEKYLVACEWVTKNAGLEIFTAAHVFTCFRAMKWSEPKDFTKPMRQMKFTHSYFECPTRKSWKMTGLGLKASAAINNPPE